MKRGQQKADAIINHLFGPAVSGGSASRAGQMIDIIRTADTPTFWRVISEVWNSCDDTWSYRGDFLRLMRLHAAIEGARDYMGDECRAFFDSLPARIQVYRGCSASRVRGISWTTEPEPARHFARGHRWISVPDPVIATATVPKKAVFFVSTDRVEREIVLDPRRLSELLVEPFQDNLA